MRKLISIVLLFVIWSTCNSQTPQTFKYQAVVRAADGGTVANTIIGFKASILKNGANGTLVYSETFSIATNDYGVVNLEIGNGTPVVGIFSTINWGADTYFIRTEIDIDGGTNYQFMGSSQLLSVPYALYAENARNAADDYDKDSLNEIQTITKTGNTITVSKNGGSVIDSDDQTLTKVGDSIALVNGGKVKDSDNQQLTLNGNTLQISNGNSVQIGGTIDLDWDPTNELQTISKHGDSITISNGNTIALNIDTTNQLQTLTKSGDSIVLSKNGGVVMDIDNQSLTSSKSGNVVTLNITRGTGTNFDIRDNDSDSINELQVLSFANDTLRLSKGNFVVLPISKIVPTGTCITSTSPTPPEGYVYSGNSTESTDSWVTEGDPLGINYILAVCNGKIYNSYSPTLFQEYSTITKTWVAKSQMSTPRNCELLITCNNKIYAIGGSNGSTNYPNKVEEYNTINNTWATLVDLPSHTNSIFRTTVASDNKLYIFANNNYIEYDPTGNTYTGKASLGVNDTISEWGCSYNNNNYYFGHRNGNRVIFKFNILANNWSVVTIMPDYIGVNDNSAGYNFLSSAQLISYNGKIFVIMDNVTTYGAKSAYYDISSNTWTTIPNVPCTWNSPHIVGLDNKIYVLGNEMINISTFTSMNYCYDILNNNWANKTPFPYKSSDKFFLCNNLIYGLKTDAKKILSYKNGITFYIHCKN